MQTGPERRQKHNDLDTTQVRQGLKQDVDVTQKHNDMDTT